MEVDAEDALFRGVLPLFALAAWGALPTSAFAQSTSSSVPASPSGAGVVRASAEAPADGTAPGTGSSEARTSTLATPSGLEEIIVTAERRSRDLQRTAASVNVQSGDELLSQGRFTLDSILESVPGVSGATASGTGGGGTDTPVSGIIIRGIGTSSTSSTANISAVPAVAAYVDEVYNGLGGTYDIDRVEVLRGPQGTLYGRSATAGVVASHTHDPNLTTASADGVVEIGNSNLWHFTGILNLPLADQKVALRIAGNSYHVDGYHSPAETITTNDLKAKLLLNPIDDVSILVGAALQENKIFVGGKLGYLSSPGNFYYTDAPLGSGENRFRQVWADIKIDLGAVVVTYIPALRTWNQHSNIYVVGPGGDLMLQKQATPNDRFLTQELRLASNGGGALTWQTGVFYYNNTLGSTNYQTWNVSGAFIVSQVTERHTTDFGVFGEATLTPREGLRITGGLRYDHTKVVTSQDYGSNLNFFAGTTATRGQPEMNDYYTLTSEAGTRHFKNTTYKARVEYDVAPRNLVYASVSTGFLPGDVQVTTGADGHPVAVQYEAETLTAYEIGSKNRFLDNRLQVNLAAYYYDYGGYQTSVQTDPANPATARQVNVPMHVSGAELEILYQLTPHDRLSTNAGYTRSRFVNEPAEFTAAVSDTELAGVPHYTADIQYGHTFELAGGDALLFNIEANYKSGYNVSYTSQSLPQTSAFNHVNPYALINGNLTWTSASGKYSISAYIRNIFDKVVAKTVQIQMGIDGSIVASGTQSVPRTFGVVFSAGL